LARVTWCSRAEAIQTAKFDSVDDIGGNDVVDEAIEEAQSEVSGDYGDPPKKSTFVLDSTQARYEFRTDNKKVFRVDRVIIRDDNNNRITYTSGTASEANLEYTEDLEFNTITFHSSTVGTYDGDRVEVHYIPSEIHHMVRCKAALHILDRVNVFNAEENTPTLGLRLLQRITRLENTYSETFAVGSEDEITYDVTSGDVIPQRRFWTY